MSNHNFSNTTNRAESVAPKHVVRIITKNNIVHDFEANVAVINKQFVVRCGAYAAKHNNKVAAMYDCGKKIASSKGWDVKEIKAFGDK